MIDTKTDPRFNTFVRRTFEHIQRVRANGVVLMREMPELSTFRFMERLLEHDLTKFQTELREGYIMLTDKFAKGTKYSSEDEKVMELAWKAHQSKEPHHREYWQIHYGDTSHMHNEALAEMVCDWHAMSQELNNKTLDWYNKVTGGDEPQWDPTQEQREYILKCIEILEPNNM